MLRECQGTCERAPFLRRRGSDHFGEPACTAAQCLQSVHWKWWRPARGAALHCAEGEGPSSTSGAKVGGRYPLKTAHGHVHLPVQKRLALSLMLKRRHCKIPQRAGRHEELWPRNRGRGPHCPRWRRPWLCSCPLHPRQQHVLRRRGGCMRIACNSTARARSHVVGSARGTQSSRPTGIGIVHARAPTKALGCHRRTEFRGRSTAWWSRRNGAVAIRTGQPLQALHVLHSVLQS